MDPGCAGGLIGVPLGSHWGLIRGSFSPLPSRRAPGLRPALVVGKGLVLLGGVLANSPLRLEERSGCLKRSLLLPRCGNISGKKKHVS